MKQKEIIKQTISKLKNQSGTHSPSIATMLYEIPELKITTDACFLSNPYATDLFMEQMNKDLIETGKLRSVLEFYPPQNKEVAKLISVACGVPPEYIFAGNGAIDIIQAILHRFCKHKICVIIPTFSSYYEFVMPGIELIYYKLQKNDDYQLDPDDFISFVKKHRPDTVVIINPNNPNGSYISIENLRRILSSSHFVDNLIVDESFIHFATENDSLELINYDKWIHEFRNLVLIKSMSKDFGVAGLRAGYCIMNPRKVQLLLDNGYLWNVSGLADYFFRTYTSINFRMRYEEERKRYISYTRNFYEGLKQIPGIKILPSQANFFLVEILDDISTFDFALDLLVDYEVYVRDCSDKIGLDGKYLRIASRMLEENQVIVDAIRNVIVNKNV